jgi:hypothetical protein
MKAGGASYSFSFGKWQILFTQLQAEASGPKVFGCRFVPSYDNNPLFGFGETEAAAATDLLRAARDRDALPTDLPRMGH